MFKLLNGPTLPDHFDWSPMPVATEDTDMRDGISAAEGADMLALWAAFVSDDADLGAAEVPEPSAATTFGDLIAGGQGAAPEAAEFFIFEAVGVAIPETVADPAVVVPMSPPVLPPPPVLVIEELALPMPVESAEFG